ncbi:MAG: helix-turn-helix transcriptional regulator [Acidimicrobiia bacterium]|nr:MAG: helix-turn-helix transcriptional regulator [Acidimicrobiia bacterium]
MRSLPSLLGATTPAFEAERLILATTEMILGIMEEQGVTRAVLADRLGRTRGHVSQVLNGDRNMTLRTLAEILHALDGRAEITVTSPTALATAERHPQTPDPH